MTQQITFNGRFLGRPVTGVDRFATELLGTWLSHHKKNRTVRVVRPPSSLHVGQRAEIALVPEALGRWGGHTWEQLELSRLPRNEFLINMCNTAPMFRNAQMVVLHDAAVMAYPSVYSYRYRSWYRMLFSAIMRNSRLVATVSEFSASELMRHFGIRARGIEIISEGGEHILRRPPDLGILARLNLLDQRYVLAVGSQSANKNFSAVIKAAKMLNEINVKFVVAGGINSRIFAGLSINDPALLLAGYVTNEELRALYENAQCFVFPSLYEGFGLPPLEAMHCGCPIIVSRSAALPEVCGTAAIYCDPADPADIAAQIRLVLGASSLQQEMRQAGFARAKLYSWMRAADEFDALVANTINSF